MLRRYRHLQMRCSIRCCLWNQRVRKSKPDDKFLLTNHAPMLSDQGPQIPKYLLQLVNTRFYLPYFCFTFLDEWFLVGQLMWGKLSLQDLNLSLFLRRKFGLLVIGGREVSTCASGDRWWVEREEVTSDEAGNHPRLTWPLEQPSVASPRWPVEHVGTQPTSFEDHGKSSEAQSFDGARTKMTKKPEGKRRSRTNEACIVDNFFRSSEPLLAIALVDSVKSCLLSRKEISIRLWNVKRETHKLFLSDAESRWVPSWSTSRSIPCTFAFILKTWSDRLDCKLWNAASSRDSAAVPPNDDGGKDEESWELDGALPASISWKLIGTGLGLSLGYEVAGCWCQGPRAAHTRLLISFSR